MTSRRIVVVWALFAIALGVFVRCDALDRKLFWQDEAFSALRISGHLQSDLKALFDGRLRPAGDLIVLQHVSPQRGVAATLSSIVREEPQRGPLYYLTARLWAGAFGDSVRALRAFSALLGIIGIGLAFLVGRQLAGSALGGLVTAALFALAPLEVDYARQAREYVALVDAGLLSWWLLMRAAERPTFTRWFWHGVGVAIGLYTFVGFAALLIAEAITVAAFVRQSRSKALLAFVLSSLGGAIAFLPWAYVAWIAEPQASLGVSWLSGPYPLSSFVLKWAFNAGASFFDAEFADVRLGLVLLPVLALVGASTAWLLRTDRRLGISLAALTLCSALPLVTLDLVLHARFEVVARYQMTTWLGLTLIAATSLGRGLASANRRARLASMLGFVFLVACGAFCALYGARYSVWWDDNEHFSEALVGKAISAKQRPLVIAEGERANFVLALGRYLPSDAKLALFPATPASLPRYAGPTFLFLPSALLRALAAEQSRALALENVSPQLGITIPDLRAQSDVDPEIQPGNALWLVVPRNQRAQRASSRRWARGAKSTSLSMRRKASRRMRPASARFSASASPSSRWLASSSSPVAFAIMRLRRSMRSSICAESS